MHIEQSSPGHSGLPLALALALALALVLVLALALVGVMRPVMRALMGAASLGSCCVGSLGSLHLAPVACAMMLRGTSESRSGSCTNLMSVLLILCLTPGVALRTSTGSAGSASSTSWARTARSSEG